MSPKKDKSAKNGKGVPGIFSAIQIDASALDGHYNKGNTIACDDTYTPYTIYDNAIDRLSTLPPSTTGSLSSITTTSIASSEPGDCTGTPCDENHGHKHHACAHGRAGGGGGPGGHGGAGGVGGVGGGEVDDHILAEKLAHKSAMLLKQEKWWQTTIQVSIPFFLAGIGTIGAGIILGRVEHWKVFVHVGELFILVPSLLGLKGNLDMCLASRLSTQANLGNMDSTREVLKMIVGNISLVQIQATVASFCAALFAICVGAFMNEEGFQFNHAMLVIASGMFTATSASFVLDFVLVAVIILSKKYKMNPDNLATPLAASIGDVVAISLFSFIASLLFQNIETHLWVTFVIVAGYCCLLPMWIFIVYRNKYTRTVLTDGWVPVLSALFISGMGGLVLDAAVGNYKGFVVFQPIINGIGGNLVSVQASKISTMLHQSSLIGIIPPHAKIFELPWRALFSSIVPYAKTAKILILMSIPGQILFIFCADYIHMGQITLGSAFVFSYSAVSLLQICLLLYTSHVIIHAMWKYKIDPDNSAIPYLTALGDLLGSSLLFVAFAFLTWIGRSYGDQQDLVTPVETYDVTGEGVLGIGGI